MQADDLVLVIDDDEEMRSYFELALASTATVQTHDGRGSSVPTPRLAFVDLLLGEQDGLEWIERLVQRGSIVVVTTGLANDAPLVAQARRLGAQHFLYKPFRLADLRALTARLLAT